MDLKHVVDKFFPMAKTNRVLGKELLYKRSVEIVTAVRGVSQLKILNSVRTMELEVLANRLVSFKIREYGKYNFSDKTFDFGAVNFTADRQISIMVS